ncbi:DUF4340 domain-containing protein [Archangium gephyra]|uniref:DUF4340 domain-containing protein n=1 Tax=Archangium gephyra TaxID=48 RepID=UPI0035D4F648
MKRGTLIALGAFAVLLVLVLATRERQVSVGVRKLEPPKLDKARVTALELTGARGATLRKEGEGWIVADPGKPDTKYAADERLVNTVIEALGEVKNPDFVTDRAERLAEYELDDAKGLKLKVIHGGGPAVEWVLGKNARNGGVYLRQAGSNDVFAHRGRLDWTVRKELKDWRKRQLVSLEAEKISQLVLRSKEGESITLKKSGASPGSGTSRRGRRRPRASGSARRRPSGSLSSWRACPRRTSSRGRPRRTRLRDSPRRTTAWRRSSRTARRWWCTWAVSPRRRMALAPSRPGSRAMRRCTSSRSTRPRSCASASWTSGT